MLLVKLVSLILSIKLSYGCLQCTSSSYPPPTPFLTVDELTLPLIKNRYWDAVLPSLNPVMLELKALGYITIFAGFGDWRGPRATLEHLKAKRVLFLACLGLDGLWEAEVFLRWIWFWDESIKVQLHTLDSSEATVFQELSFWGGRYHPEAYSLVTAAHQSSPTARLFQVFPSLFSIRMILFLWLFSFSDTNCSWES